MARRRDKSEDPARSTPLERLRLFGDPTLKQMTRDVTHFDSRLEALSDLMFDVMEREGGVGLAAPQIGTLSRVMVWKNPDDEDSPYTFVNPRITVCSLGDGQR